MTPKRGGQRYFLASQSPRRQEILRQVGLEFGVIRPDCDEVHSALKPELLVTKLAQGKAESVLSRVKSGVVIGVDTVVVLGSEVLGKPCNKADARRMMRALSGRTHRVISGVCVIRLPDRRCLCSVETSRVSFRRLTRDEIESYIATAEPYDKAGAYAIQGRAGGFVRRIEGDYLNIVGLPLVRLLGLLRRLGRA